MAEAAPEKPNELTHELLSRGLCVSPSGKVLLCRIKAAAHRSFLPGGHIDPGEGARRALEREIAEELALGCRAGRFLGAAEHFFGAKGSETFEMNVVFALEIPALRGEGGEEKAPRSAEPWQEFFWCDPERLAEAGFEPASLRPVVPGWVRAVRGGGTGRETPDFASTYENMEPRQVR